MRIDSLECDDAIHIQRNRDHDIAERAKVDFDAPCFLSHELEQASSPVFSLKLRSVQLVSRSHPNQYGLPHHLCPSLTAANSPEPSYWCFQKNSRMSHAS